MIRKQSEAELASMFRRLGFYAHKWRDRGYVSCPICHRQIVTCPYCKSSMLLPKAETKPDYLVAEKYIYVEVKSATDRFSFSDISDTQRRVLEEHESWLFIVIGTGKAPSGREAYLITWEAWKTWEQVMLAEGRKSLNFRKGRNLTMHEVFGIFQLNWEPRVGWTIPSGHMFWIGRTKDDIHVADSGEEPRSTKMGN